MWKSKFISINNIIFILLISALIAMFVFAYLYLIKPIFLPQTEHFLLSNEVKIQKELFEEVVSKLEKRAQNSQDALEKQHVDPFRF